MSRSRARSLTVSAVLIAATIFAGKVSTQAPADLAAPLIAVTSPGTDAVVSGTVTVSATAYDAVGVAGVQFVLDGEPLGAEDAVAPFTVSWNTAAGSAGAHLLSALARDEAGNVGDSDLVPVIVGYSVTPPPPPPPLNNSPAAVSDAITTPAGTPMTFTAAFLLANDSDADGDPLAVTSVGPSTTASGAVVANAGGTWTYTPPAGFTGADTFTYSVADNRGGTASAIVHATVSVAPGGGLVAALSFDEPSGATAADASGNGNAGTIRGAVRVAGIRGQALQFDGADDWVTVPDAASLDLVSGMTLEAWVRPGAMTGWETVLLKERGADQFAYALYAHDGGALSGGAPVPSGNVDVSAAPRTLRGPSTLPAEQWTHLATTYDGATQRIFVNGAQVASRAQGGSITLSGGVLRIGGNNSFAGEFFEGLIDDVRVYNRALSAAEIAGDMAGGAAPPPPPPPPPPAPPAGAGLVLSLSFDEASGSALDGSGNGNAGTIRGAARVAGVRGYALSFDGVDDWVTVADAASLDLATGMTLEAWVNPATLDGWDTVLLKQQGVGAFSYALYAHDGGGLPEGAPVPSGNVRVAAAPQTVRGPAQLPAGVWTHVATTFNGVTQRLFVNGVEVSSRPQSGTISVGSGVLRVGGNSSFPGEFFKGLIDEVRIYNRALSAEEILAGMN
jgi:hypothetical protein